jgi:ATP-dependent DNA helicase RecQ
MTTSFPPFVETDFGLLEKALKRYFGYDSFRPGQQQIIEVALHNQDLLVLMPTGGGKSLCFQLPALLKSGLTIVVSPLIALMQDQVQLLQTNGIPATFLNSSLSSSEIRERANEIRAGRIKLLYVAPERLLSDEFLFNFLPQVHEAVGLVAFAIDEAHCVSEWGHDFRPEYRQIAHLRQHYPNVPIWALTATATERVRSDIISQLQLRQPFIHIGSFNRPNLYYEVRPKHRRAYEEMVQQIGQTSGAGIVYCLSRKRVEEVAERLKQAGISALPYHAGMSNEQRKQNQDRFIRDDVQVIVATVAFGMGINKPDVRFVIHFDLPRNIEGYYQESGRAGRDGESAVCTLYYGPGDIKTIEFLIGQKVDPNTGVPLEEEQRIAAQQLRRVIQYAEALECRRIIQLGYFSEPFPGQCGMCDNCRYPKPLEDWTIEAQKMLSCVARFAQRGQKFGMAYTIAVLRGSREKRILQNRHDQLSTYGIGKERSLDEWRMLGRSLLHQGLVDEATDGYAVLALNSDSWQVLRGQRQVMMAVAPKPEDSSQTSTPADDEQVEALFKRLQRLRKRLADEQQVPPYVVFSNATLRFMAQLQPQNRAQFAQLSGVGDRKLAQYGEIFIAEILAFRDEHGLSNDQANDPREIIPIPLPQSSPLARLGDTHQRTLELYQQGLKPADIAAARDLRLGTILSHLSDLLESGERIEIDRLVAPERQVAIVAAIRSGGELSLSAIRDRAGEGYGYDEIRLVRAWWRYRGREQSTWDPAGLGH